MPSLERITHKNWTYRKKVGMVMTSGNIVLVPFIRGGHGWGRNGERGFSSSRHRQMREEKEYHVLS